MTPVVIPGATRALGAPDNWDPDTDGPCGALPIRDGVHAEVWPYMESAWKPDAQELAALNAGGSIVLRIVNLTHPVVALYVIEDAAPEADPHAALGVIAPDQPAGEPA